MKFVLLIFDSTTTSVFMVMTYMIQSLSSQSVLKAGYNELQVLLEKDG